MNEVLSWGKHALEFKQEAVLQAENARLIAFLEANLIERRLAADPIAPASTMIRRKTRPLVASGLAVRDRARRPGGALVPAALFAFMTTANATCQQQCRNDSAYTSCVQICEGDVSRRVEESINAGRQRAPAAPWYGAIALSPKTGKGASVWRQPSREYAQKHVVSFCEQSHGAGDCRAVMWFRGGWCGASAWSTGRQWGSASASTKRQAEVKALEICRNNGGSACRIKQSLCSG